MLWSWYFNVWTGLYPASFSCCEVITTCAWCNVVCQFRVGCNVCSGLTTLTLLVCGVLCRHQWT